MEVYRVVAAVVWMGVVAAGSVETSEASSAFVVAPGRPRVVEGAAYVHVVASQRWSLDVATTLVGPDGHPAASTVTATLTPYEKDGTPGGEEGVDAGVSDGVDVSDAGFSTVLHGEPTGDTGRTYRMDVAVDPSWDDPAGVPLTAVVRGRLSKGARMTATYVGTDENDADDPAKLYVFLSGSDAEADLLDVVVTFVHKETGRIRTVEETVSTDRGWHGVAIPDDLPRGTYVYSGRTSDGQTFGPGEFTIGGEEAGFSGVMAGVALFFADDDDAHVADGLPDVRMYVDPAVALPGRIGRWSVRVMNTDVRSVPGARLDVCFPSGWLVEEVDRPYTTTVDGGRLCYGILLGTIGGRTHKTVELSVVQWPPQERRSARVDDADTADVRLVVQREDGGFAPLRAMRVPLLAESLGIIDDVRVRGTVFFDENKNGVRDEGESGVGGVDIVVDGRVYRQSSRTGAFTLYLTPGVHTIWARGATGRSVPVPVRVGPVEGDPIQLPFIERDERDGPTRSEYYVTSRWSGGYGKTSPSYSVYAAHTGLWGQVDWYAAPSGSGGQAVFPGPGYRWHGQWYSGVPRTMRFSALRPSMPVQNAWSVGWYGLPRMMPGAAPAVVASRVEIGQAEDDYWRCRLVTATLDWSRGASRWGVHHSAGMHVRRDERGVRRETIGVTAAQGAGRLPFTDDDWRYSWAAYAGKARRLSPSCGQSPRDGVHVHVGFHPPDAREYSVIDGLRWAVSRWSNGNEAMEVSLLSRSLPLTRPDVDIGQGKGTARLAVIRFVPTIQWGDDGGRRWLRPGLAVQTDVGDHHIDVQLGHRPLEEAERELDVRRGAGRRFVRWRWQPGRLGLTVGMELSGADETLRRSAEVGLRLYDVVRPGTIPGLASSRLDLSRTHLATRLRDDVALRADVFGHAVRWYGVGRRARRPEDPFMMTGAAYDTYETETSIVGPLAQLLPFFEKATWEWTTRHEREEHVVRRERSMSVRGRWTAGQWGVAAGRKRYEAPAWTDVDTFIHVQGTCACRSWRLEAGVHRVVRRRLFGGSDGARTFTAWRALAVRPLNERWSGVAEWSVASVRDGRLLSAGAPSVTWTKDADEAKTPAALKIGVEWTPASNDGPVIIGAGLRIALDEGRRDGGLGWFVHVRMPMELSSSYEGEEDAFGE